MREEKRGERERERERGVLSGFFISAFLLYMSSREE
jgi:hypothetical protein